MTSTLEELQTKLYEVFDGAASRAESDYADDAKRAENAKAAATVATAIIALDARLEEREQLKTGLRLPGKP